MKLDKLTIERRPNYGEHAGKYVATVTVTDDASRITMTLSPEVSAVVLRDCIEHLCLATDGAAQEMKQRLMASLPPCLPA